MSTSALGLQNKLNRLNKYCQMWNLNVNIKKTKIVVFNPSGKIFNQYKFLFNNKVIEMVPDYVYLGLKLHCTGNFSVAINDLVMKGKKPYTK
jgi:hypothetical protein